MEEILSGRSPSFNFWSRYVDTELAKAFEPVVLHFMGPLKQWVTPCFAEHHPARRELDAFLKKTPWPSFVGSKHEDSKHLDDRIHSLRELKNRHPNLISFLTTTQFADVEQGLTRPQLQHLEGLDY